MNKIKPILLLLLIPFFILLAFACWKIKSKEDFKQKIVLAVETRKVLSHLMPDIYQAREDSFEGVPADGLWHHRFVFIHAHDGVLEYRIKEGHLFRINKGQEVLIADDIADLRIRRQQETPDILEVQIKAQKEVSLVSNLKIRIHQ